LKEDRNEFEILISRKKKDWIGGGRRRVKLN
jgi:hypothetical protein